MDVEEARKRLLAERAEVSALLSDTESSGRKSLQPSGGSDCSTVGGGVKSSNR